MLQETKSLLEIKNKLEDVKIYVFTNSLKPYIKNLIENRKDKFGGLILHTKYSLGFNETRFCISINGKLYKTEKITTSQFYEPKYLYKNISKKEIIDIFDLLVEKTKIIIDEYNKELKSKINDEEKSFEKLNRLR